MLELIWRLYMFGPEGLSYRAMEALRPIGEAGVLQPSAFPEVIYELKPNLDTMLKNARLITNAQGLADQAYALEKSAGTFRVVVLGDSFTMPSGVPIQEAYHTVLEDRLNQESAGRRYEFINFGVGGYNLRIYLAVLERKALAYAPDVVLIGFCPVNDTEVMPEYHFQERYKAKRIGRAFLRMYSFERLQRLIADAFSSHQRKEPDYNAPYMRDMFSRFASATQGRIPVVVANLNHRPTPKPLVNLLKQLCTEHGFHFIDLSGFFKTVDASQFDVHQSDTHPNAKAHRIFADLLGDFMKHEGLLGERNPAASGR